jgi:hypothetical protein
MEVLREVMWREVMWREVMWREVCEKIQHDLLPTLTMGYAYWWPVNALLFRFVPSLFRPVGMSVCSVAWGCYLSLVQYKDTVVEATPLLLVDEHEADTS